MNNNNNINNNNSNNINYARVSAGIVCNKTCSIMIYGFSDNTTTDVGVTQTPVESAAASARSVYNIIPMRLLPPRRRRFAPYDVIEKKPLCSQQSMVACYAPLSISFFAPTGRCRWLLSWKSYSPLITRVHNNWFLYNTIILFPSRNFLAFSKIRSTRAKTYDGGHDFWVRYTRASCHRLV